MVAIKPHIEQYYLNVKFGTGKDSSKNIRRLIGAINPIHELTIIQSINRFLPTFRLKIQDIGGAYTNLKPYDKKQNRVQIAFSRDDRAETASIFDFDVYRRFPTSDSLYDIEGVLQIDNFFRPNKIRGFSGTIKDTLSEIANELGIDEVDISPTLDFRKNIVQPYWTNVELLDYLKRNLIGKESEAPYFCYITCRMTANGMKKVFVFKSLKELYSQKVKYTFSDIPVASYDGEADKIYYPILDFKAYDNYKLLETSGCKQVDYGYFDYDEGTYKLNSITVDNYYSLTQYFSINQDSTTDNVGETDTGRSNDFTSDFEGKSKGTFFKKINNLSMFWITTWGLEDIYPGDIVRLQFLKDPVNMLSQQYHGFWMVERIVHLLGQVFGTRLLLTRNGINTVEDTMLKVADNRKRG